LFANSHSLTVEESVDSDYDWLLVDCRHGLIGYETMFVMLGGVAIGAATITTVTVFRNYSM
jgi:2-keto-3-deoxy-L-rhamnonate aldolase RhmA